MNKYKKIINIIQIPIKLMLVVLMIFISFEYFNKVFINKEVGHGNSYRAMPENSVDVLVLGSSDAQYSFVPSFFFEDTELYSYIIGTPCQPLEVSYEMLKEALKTQKPKLLLLEVFTAMPLRSICEDDVCYVVAQYQMTGREKYNTINYLPEEKAKEYRNDFVNYHNDWRTREDYESLLPSNVYKNDSKLDEFFGYVFNDDSKIDFYSNHWLPAQYSTDLDVQLDELDLVSLNNIYELCIQNNIELLLYKTPIDGITQEDQSYLHKVWEWAEEKGIKYIDFVEKAKEIKFYMQIHSDSFHCYTNGASMLSGYIADFVNENYEFDHIKNDYLDETYKRNVWDLSANVLKIEKDPLVYLKRLKNTEGIICLKYSPIVEDQIGPGFYNALCDLGCSRFDINTNYYAIIKDGYLLYEDISPIEYDIDNNKISFNNNIINVNDTEYKMQGAVSILYLNKENIEEGIIKNIDYYPFPWDHNEKVYQ